MRKRNRKRSGAVAARLPGAAQVSLDLREASLRDFVQIVAQSTGRNFILDQWWVATMPGFAIILVSLGFCFLGDGLRDVLDPKQGEKQ